jgi:hypothetical protein
LPSIESGIQARFANMAFAIPDGARSAPFGKMIVVAAGFNTNVVNTRASDLFPA